jgi:hypothetical protein
MRIPPVVRTALVGAVVTVAASAAMLSLPGAAQAHGAGREPGEQNRDMQRMHELHLQEVPGMQRMHQLHMRGVPGMQRMHERHMQDGGGMPQMREMHEMHGDR